MSRNTKLSMKPAQFEKLLRSWGGEEVKRGATGHSKWKIRGQVVTTTGRGRECGVPVFAAMLAAKELGISKEEFLAGPKKGKGKGKR